MSKSTHLVLLARLAVWLASAGPQPPSVRGGDDATSRPAARAETERVPSRGNAADDPAIWVHLSADQVPQRPGGQPWRGGPGKVAECPSL